MSSAADLVGVVRRCPWLMGVLATVAAVDATDGWVGAGVVRDVVWGERFGGGFDPATVSDVDVVYFEADDLRPERDGEIEAQLQALRPHVRWEAKNQAAVHLWYPRRFGVEVMPLVDVADAVATWPETAVTVAVRLGPSGDVEVLAPLGLDDLFDGVWRRNPRRVTREEYERRLAAKRPEERWPGVRVAPSDAAV